MNVETPSTTTRRTARFKLQWSHVLMNVETTSNARKRRSPRTSLQWSHVLMNVETVARAVVGELRQLASMEPRPHERGNT